MIAKNTSEILPARESISWDLHPLVRRRYTLATPMVLTLMAQVVDWIKNGVTGAIIEGNPRLGKTKLRRFLAKALPIEIPGILAFSLLARRYVTPSERVFFGDLLQAVGHKMHLEGTASQRRDRLTESIIRMIKRSGQTRMVIIVDQAHHLQVIQYEWLIDLYDEINEAGVDLFVLLIGQRELSGICDDLKRAGKTQIIGRFMVGRSEYFGIRTHDELNECLSCYDSRTAYPEGTSWTFSRYFFPDAFGRGWRLASISKILWKLFTEVRTPYSLASSKVEIPLQNFAMVAERILLETRQTVAGDPIITEKQLVQFISAAYSVQVGSDNAETEDEEEE